MRNVILVAICLALCNRAIAQNGDVVGVHDPCIIKDGSIYYLFSTGGHLPMRRSRDLKTWEHVGEALSDIPPWATQTVPEAKGCWAPDVARFNGKFHLYYSVSSFGSNRSCIGLATNVTLDRKAPEYKWEDHGLVVESRPDADNFNAIDPNVVFDDTNRPWLSFGSSWRGIMLLRLDSKTGKPAGKPFHIAGRNGEAIEAPFIFRHGQWYYLFVSFDECCKGSDSTYKIMVGRSQRVDGPYLDFLGEKMTDGAGTLVLARYRSVRGPGHNAVLSDSGTDFLVHHYYDSDSGGRATLQIRPMLWTKNGWPLAGESGFVGDDKANKSPVMSGKWEHGLDYGQGNSITLLPNGKINPDDGKATWKLTGSVLELRWPRADAPRGVWIDECIVSPNGDSYIGRNQQGLVIRGVRLR